MGIWPGHRGYTPTLYEKFHGIFNDHRESGPRFNVSSERDINSELRDINSELGDKLRIGR